MESATRWAVVRSGLRKARRNDFNDAESKWTSRSTMAPDEMRPLVGTPRVTDSP